MKVALVHEFLTQIGGAERVLVAFHELFPEAPVYTLVHDGEKTRGVFRDLDIRTGFLQNFPRNHYKWALPLMARAIESFDFSQYDLVLSDSSAFAKGAVTKKPTIHICYCHTPTRYLWESMDEYIANLPYNRLVKAVAKHYLNFNLKKWDYQAAQRPDFFIANSQTVQERIKKYYGRESEVIYPPVDMGFFKGSNGGKGGEVELGKNYFLTVSRLEPYKKIDLVIGAFAKLELPLKVVGSGTMQKELRIKNYELGDIEFLGRVGDNELRKLYQGARALVFPAFEDAGIVTLEALASGTPVIGLAGGGTAEFVRDGENGVLFAAQTVEDIIGAVRRFETMNFEPTKLRESTLAFDKQNFKKNILAFIRRVTSPQPYAHRD